MHKGSTFFAHRKTDFPLQLASCVQFFAVVLCKPRLACGVRGLAWRSRRNGNCQVSRDQSAGTANHGGRIPLTTNKESSALLLHLQPLHRRKMTAAARSYLGFLFELLPQIVLVPLGSRGPALISRWMEELVVEAHACSQEAQTDMVERR